MANKRQETLGIPCRARTRTQMETAYYDQSKIGCAYLAMFYVDPDGKEVDPETGVPICTRHRNQWQKGFNYGVNPS